MIERPIWYIEKNNLYDIDLSKNIHYDRILNIEIKNHLRYLNNFNNYPNEFQLYDSISKYYKIPIQQLSIGFGATDLIERIFKAINLNKLYIVSPTFEMIEIYCQIYKVPYEKISDIDVLEIIDQNSSIYIANPNGLTGKIIDVSLITNNFKFCIIDEVYADFNNSQSLLYKNLDNVVIIKSLSKSLGLAGFRVGFSVASFEITQKIQSVRMNYITNSVSCLIIPKIISLTDDVIDRMKITKNYLESNFLTIKSHGNFVLFKNTNKYTEKFGCKIINGLYRMALTDMETLNE